jgi:hypothetical protein
MADTHGSFSLAHLSDGLHVIVIQSDHDEWHWRQTWEHSPQIEFIDLYTQWTHSNSFEQFINYTTTSEFCRPQKIVYIHPIGVWLETKRAMWNLFEKYVHGAKAQLLKHCQRFHVKIILMIPIDEMSCIAHPSDFEWHHLPVFETEHSSLHGQWVHLKDEQLADLLISFPLLWNHSAVSQYFLHYNVIRYAWRVFLPLLYLWKAKDFMKRASFQVATTAFLGFLQAYHGPEQGETTMVSSEDTKQIHLVQCFQTIKTWAVQRRSHLITFDWFYHTALRPVIKPTACKTKWLHTWRDREHWTSEEMCERFDPRQLLASIESFQQKFQFPYDPMWRHSRLPITLTVTEESWFHHFRRGASR